MIVLSRKDNGLIVEGEVVAVIPEGAPVSEEAMWIYYELKPGMRDYDSIAAPNPFERIIVQRENGNIVIIPFREDLYQFIR